MTLSIGKLRGLQQLASPKGLFIMVAADHRESLKKMLAEGLGREATYQDMVDFKLELCRAAAPYGSALLLDPIYAASQTIAAGVLPGGTGLLVSIEESGYKGSKRARTTDILGNWGVEKIKRMGASAVKLLVYYRPDLRDVSARQLDVVSRIAADCVKADIPLVTETVTYAISDKEDDPREFAKIKPQLVIETARQLSDIPLDVLKTEFPGDLSYEKDEKKLLDYCHQLDAATKHPWVILSGGHNFEMFRREVELACKGGASGFLAGRALWQEVVKVKGRQERIDFFNGTMVPRLKEIVETANKYGRPWSGRLSPGKVEFPSPSEDWYKGY